MPNIASSAPDIMIVADRGATEHQRVVGSGGVMLPKPRTAAGCRRFKVLEGLFPAASISVSAARRPPIRRPPTRCGAARTIQPATIFLDRFQELLAFEGRLFPESHPFRKVQAMPARRTLPPLFLLGSSGYSAQLAAHVGAGFSFAHHFSDFDPVGPMMTYREQFRPSATRDKPLAILAVHAVVAIPSRSERLASRST